MRETKKMKDSIMGIIKESVKAKESLCGKELANIQNAADMIIKAFKSGGKLLIFGNGGSAADSQHMAAELVGRFKQERKALAAIALPTNVSTMTALANDYGYDVTFSRQVEALGSSNDVAFAISTSGNSRNVIEAVKKARSMGIKTIGLVGGDGGKLKMECNLSITVASKDTPRIQETHITVIHILCELVEREMFK